MVWIKKQPCSAGRIFVFGRDSSLQQVASSNIDPRIIEGLERAYNGGRGFDHCVDDNLRANRIYSLLLSSAPFYARLQKGDAEIVGFLLDEAMPYVRQGVAYGFGDDALIAALAVTQALRERYKMRLIDKILERKKNGDPIEFDPQLRKKLVRLSMLANHRASLTLAEWRLRDVVIAIRGIEGYIPRAAEPSEFQIAEARRDIDDLARLWGNQLALNK